MFTDHESDPLKWSNTWSVEVQHDPGNVPEQFKD